MKQRVFSGAQPSGKFTLGNYLGALSNWTRFQDEFDCLYCIVDMHAITVRQDVQLFKRQSRDLLIQYIAAGLDPAKNILYFQSHVAAHAELAWILNCYTYMGELGRMTQFKEKSSKYAENINAGLFTYPVLMAADILLYQTNYVPVGEDQRQHLELTRDIAVRFNNIFGNVFVVPEGLITKIGAKIMSLQQPDKKMSKSDVNENNIIYLTDPPNVIMNKIKRAVTDTGNEIIMREDKPGISNLLTIYCCVTDKSIEQAQKEFDNCGYGTFKTAVGEAVVNAIEPIQKRILELQSDKGYIDELIVKNAQRANLLAEKTLAKVYKKIGFIPKTR